MFYSFVGESFDRRFKSVFETIFVVSVLLESDPFLIIYNPTEEIINPVFHWLITNFVLR